MKHHVKVWDIKITTVEQPKQECNGAICNNCKALCCKGVLIPLLTHKEFISGKYPIRTVDIPELKKDLPNAQNVIGLAMGPEGCFFLKGDRCSIYESRPQSCRVYDCRIDERSRIKEYVKRRFGK